MISSQTISEAFSALAHPSRVDILLALMPYAASGLSAGDLAQKTSIPPSTLAHHLREMEAGNVIERIAQGRKTIIKPNLTSLSSIAGLITQLCCTSEGEPEC
ncbi:helix-turn-helix domain-containing protein [Planktotalea sp.]|uniref:ArsR/SmtB family transcription factor n=1 Tax=Planktotalea sp. TaxID=2029877 RepID=UPI0025F84ECA|nr:helix-turn-helix domain-containing protein [Planktotalea sp.]